MKFYSLMRGLFVPFVKLVLRPKVSGLENVPSSGKLMLCCNHQSFLDLFVLVIVFPRQIRFMAKKELFKNPIANWFFSRLGAFPVDRGNGDKAAIKTAVSVLESDGVLGIFPEGTRRAAGKPGKAKAGAAMLAFTTGADIFPIAINYHGKAGIFSKINMSCGKVIKNATLKGESDEPDRAYIRRASGMIMDEITQLWETDN